MFRTHAILLLPLLVACAKTTSPESGGAQAVGSQAADPSGSTISETALADEGLIQQSVDFDGNGKAEIINFYQVRTDGSRQLVRKQVDMNRDGKVDVKTALNERGEIAREDIDGDYDGTFEWVDHYQDGVRMITEYDTDGDGKPNVFKYYVKDGSGKVYLDRKERDENSDGKIDLWEKFDATGAVTITGRDKDGDGNMDERIE